MAETPVGLDLLGIFVAVADETSFSRAARRLGITKGTVSRAIARLEQALGTELIHRTMHRVALSTAGIALYERTVPHLTALAHAVGRLPERAEQPSGELRLTAPHDVGVILLPELLASFALRYPEIRLDVRLTNQSLDLVGEGFDLAIRATVTKLMRNTSLKARRLCGVDARVCASPAYVARRGEPRQFAEPGHDWIVYPGMAQTLGAPRGFQARVISDDFLLTRDILREGGGVGLLPGFVAEPYVRAGLLVQLLPAMRLRGFASYFLLYPSSAQVSRKVVAFRDFLLEYLKAHPLEGL